MAKRVLVIDDDPVTVCFLRRGLERQGYEVMTAFNGLMGLEMARAEHPDLITLDIMMPELNGYSLCGFLRSDPRLKSIPIIVITSFQGDNGRAFDKDFCPDAFFNKPFSLADVLTEAEALLASERL